MDARSWRFILGALGDPVSFWLMASAVPAGAAPGRVRGGCRAGSGLGSAAARACSGQQLGGRPWLARGAPHLGGAVATTGESGRFGALWRCGRSCSPDSGREGGPTEMEAVGSRPNRGQEQARGTMPRAVPAATPGRRRLGQPSSPIFGTHSFVARGVCRQAFAALLCRALAPPSSILSTQAFHLRPKFFAVSRGQLCQQEGNLCNRRQQELQKGNRQQGERGAAKSGEGRRAPGRGRRRQRPRRQRAL